MRVSDILAKKKMVISFLTRELSFSLHRNQPKASMEPLKAFLMAVYLQGMTEREKISLTKSMMHSGAVLDWQSVLPKTNNISW